MTSRDRFEAKYGKRGDGNMSYSGWDFRWDTWQAAERDMLERVIAVFESAGPKDTFTATLIRVALKELLNEQEQ